MKNLFEHTSAPWIRYSSYEYKTDNNDNLYITVSKDAKPEMYRPMQEAEQLVIDAINVGLAAMHKASEKELKESSAWLCAEVRFSRLYDCPADNCGFHCL